MFLCIVFELFICCWFEAEGHLVLYTQKLVTITIWCRRFRRTRHSPARHAKAHNHSDLILENKLKGIVDCHVPIPKAYARVSIRYLHEP